MLFIWQSLPKAITKDTQRFMVSIAKSIAEAAAELFGQRSCTTWAGQTGKHRHRAFPSQRQLLLVTTSSIEENMLPLLRYCLSQKGFNGV